MDVLNRQAGVGLIEPDRRPARRRCEINELLKVLPARRGRQVLGEFENQVKDMPDVFRKVRNVLVKRAIVDGEKADLIILQWNKLREMRRTDGVEVFLGPTCPRTLDQFDLDEGKF